MNLSARFIFSTTLCCIALTWAPTTQAADSKQTITPTKKLYGQINAFGSACVSSGVIPLSTQLPTTVEEVKAGSPAYYAGVNKGDKILSASIETNKLNLQIERQGKIYLVKMRARTDSTQTNLKSDTTKFSLGEKLKDYRVELIVDHSGSMYRSLGNSDKMRWQWVVEQVNRFCSECEKNNTNIFDLCLFADSAQIARNLSADKIKELLQNTVTTGSTNLGQAVKLTLAPSEASNKPFLVILITDGQSVSSRENVELFVDAFNRSPALRQSKIVFLQAGYSEAGSQFIARLKSGLAARGIKESALMLLFEETSDKGILEALRPFL